MLVNIWCGNLGGGGGSIYFEIWGGGGGGGVAPSAPLVPLPMQSVPVEIPQETCCSPPPLFSKPVAPKHTAGGSLLDQHAQNTKHLD